MYLEPTDISEITPLKLSIREFAKSTYYLSYHLKQVYLTLLLGSESEEVLALKLDC